MYAHDCDTCRDHRAILRLTQILTTIIQRHPDGITRDDLWARCSAEGGDRELFDIATQMILNWGWVTNWGTGELFPSDSGAGD